MENWFQAGVKVFFIRKSILFFDYFLVSIRNFSLTRKHFLRLKLLCLTSPVQNLLLTQPPAIELQVINNVV